MVNDKTLRAIAENYNTGIEYEIALFYALLSSDAERNAVYRVIRLRNDANKIQKIIEKTSVNLLLSELKKRAFTIVDVQFTTQDDAVGPADIVLDVRDAKNIIQQLGISVKNSNTCNLNPTGSNFLSEDQKLKLKKLQPEFAKKYIEDMSKRFGKADKWFHKKKRSKVTAEFIDLIRNEVLLNWEHKSIAEKVSILRDAYHETSPIPFWIFTYKKTSQKLNTSPDKIAESEVPNVVLKKLRTAYIGFYLNDKLIGKMQVKFNNGILQSCDKLTPDINVDGIEMDYGDPFNSWNYSLIEK